MAKRYKEQETHKIWYGTLTKLRLLYVLNDGKSMSSILDRIVSDELDRLQRLEQGDDE